MTLGEEIATLRRLALRFDLPKILRMLDSHDRAMMILYAIDRQEQLTTNLLVDIKTALSMLNEEIFSPRASPKKFPGRRSHHKKVAQMSLAATRPFGKAIA